MTAAFERFEKIWHAPLRTRDAVEAHPWKVIDAAKELEGQARRELLTFLRARLKDGEGVLPAMVASSARLRELVPALKRALPKLDGWDRTEVAEALASLAGERKAAKETFLALAAEGGSPAREAVRALGAYRGKAVVTALLAAIDDEDEKVRWQATNSLIVAARLAKERDRGWQRLRTYLHSEHAPIRRYGKGLFEEACRRRAAGEEMGELAWPLMPPERSEVFDRFWEQLRPERGRSVLDLELAERFSPLERYWAEYALLHQFLAGEWPVGPELAAVGGELTGSVLGEVLPELDDETADGVLEVLAELGGKKGRGRRA